MKLLVLLSRFPYPLEKGDKLRAYNQIKELSKHHQIYLCCLSFRKIPRSHIKELKPYCEDIKIIRLSFLVALVNLGKAYFTHKPFQVAYFYQNRAQRKIDHYIEKHLPQHIYCQLIRTSEYVLKYTIFHKTLDFMDALSTGIERRIESVPVVLKSLFKEEAKRLKSYESSVFKHFTHKTIISEQDRNLIDHQDNEKIEIIRNGVNLDFFQPRQVKSQFDLVFTGNMSYPPNVDCAIFLVNDVLPLIHEQSPNVNLLISGANPSIKVRSLASKNVTVTGWVDDIRESYAKSKVFIAPMRMGTGLQNKLLEAMAMKIPCITSKLANNALGGENGTNILVGTNAKEFAEMALALLNDEPSATTIADRGHNFVKKMYDWSYFGVKLNKLITQH